LELERLYDSAMKDIEIQFKLKQDKIRGKLDDYRQHSRDADQALDLISLRIKGQSMQKFVKDYMSTLKDVEGVLKKKIRIDSHFENSVLDLRVKAPFFNYMIGQRNHKGEVMSVSMSMMKSV
jgi:hypothetical protein